MTLRKDELTAMVKMAMVMAEADDVVKDEEYGIIGGCLTDFGLTAGQAGIIADVAEEMDPSYAISVLSKMSIDQKKYVSSFLANVMAADEDLSDDEIQLWVEINVTCGFPRMDFEEALDYWQEH